VNTTKAGLPAGPRNQELDSSTWHLVCSCGRRFADEWEALQHRLLGKHHYRSRASLSVTRVFEPLAPVRDLPSRVDLRRQCSRCLAHAEDTDLVVLDGRLFHKGGCAT